MTLYLVFPLPPQRANARGHWAKTYRAQRAWTAAALHANPILVRGLPPEERIAHAVLEATLVVSRAMDEDNAVARLKWALDILRPRTRRPKGAHRSITLGGIIVDDDPDHLTILPVIQEVRPKRVDHRLLITLTATP